MSEVRRLAAAAWLLIALAPPAQGDERSREDEMVCVPSADGRSWECGTRASPPPERGLSSLPRTPSRAAAPPPFLAAPGARAVPLAPASEPPRTPSARDAFRPAPDRDPPRAAAEVATVAESAPVDAAPPVAPGAATEAPAAGTPASAPTAAPPTAPAAAPAPPPLLAAPRPRLAPYAPSAPPTPAPAATPVETAPVAAEPVAAEPVAAEPVAAEPVAAEPAAAEPAAAEPVAAPPEAVEPVATQAIDTPPPAGRDAFLALPPQRATLQLARAARVGELYAIWRQLVANSGGALAQGTAYVVTLDAGGAAQALLLWSDFADTGAARAAWEALPGFAAGKPAAYARRIAPLQDEVRRAPSEP